MFDKSSSLRNIGGTATIGSIVDGHHESDRAPLGETGKVARKKFSWPPEAVEKLKEIFATGATHDQIADELSKEYDREISERGVKAQCHKLGLFRHVLVSWKPEQDDILRDGVRDGKTYREIAGELGVTRNAVIGRANRLGLAMPKPVRSPEEIERINQLRRERKNAKRRRSPIARIRNAAPPRSETVMRCAEIDPLHVSLNDLEPHMCRWPYGEGPFTFCGHDKQGNKSYCPAHFLLSLGAGTPSELAAHKISRRHLEGV